MATIDLSSPAVQARRHAVQARDIAITVSVTLAAGIFVALRFWARRMSRTGCRWDDWLMLAAVIVR